jgi:hypothetical protein
VHHRAVREERASIVVRARDLAHMASPALRKTGMDAAERVALLADRFAGPCVRRPVSPLIRARDGVLQSDALARSLALFTEALQAAHREGRGVPPSLQPLARQHAHDFRIAGGGIAALLVTVKTLIRETTGTDEPVFTPRVVGWAIAGYFEGSSPSER